MHTVFPLFLSPVPAGEKLVLRGFFSRLRAIGFPLSDVLPGAAICCLICCRSAVMFAAAEADPSTLLLSLDVRQPGAIPGRPGAWQRDRLQGFPCWVFHPSSPAAAVTPAQLSILEDLKK